MESIVLYQPKSIIFGEDVLQQLPDDCSAAGYRNILLLYATPLARKAKALADLIRERGTAQLHLLEYEFGEPTIKNYQFLLEEAQACSPDCVIGMGGGSVLDSAKLIATLWNNVQSIRTVFGKNLLIGRTTALITVPTTSGTGSEVSPNAILFDERDEEKKGVISPFLVPDSCYIDPTLMIDLPPRITAETAMDALSHCIEAYTNLNHHPLVDVYAIAGIRLITTYMEAAYHVSDDLNARAALALGSLYGGLCLGPVNTAGVHALAYGLSNKYHIPHGLANAVLLPEVMSFNMPAAPQRTQDIARAMGVSTGREAIDRLIFISMNCDIPQTLDELGIDPSDVPMIAASALKSVRLLDNNPRKIGMEEAICIYNNLF
jgi:alcohol dehydrogenase class IV